MLHPVTYAKDGIHIQAYPFAPASVYPSAIVPWADIQACLPDRAPPEIWTTRGDILFIPAHQRDDLRVAATHHHIPNAHAIDTWALILEPFLDTTFDTNDQERTRALLAQAGIDEHTCQALRERFGKLMLAYNFDTGLWDWVHLGLYDLLNAHWLFRTRFALTDATLHARYWETIAIARHSPLIMPP